MNNIKKGLLFLSFAIFIVTLSGCNKIDSVKERIGIKNKDFEYIKQGKINKIIIQNTRDEGFRFIVTDKNAILELYDILSTAKKVNEKSTLAPDYVFEMHEGTNKIYKFNYIAGLDKKDGGNLYSDNGIYIVSKRIDNDIIKNFWNIRKPKDFQWNYYQSIVEVLKKYTNNIDGSTKIGVDLSQDVDTAKFILSTDLEDFKSNLKSQYDNAYLVENKDEKYDVIFEVKTYGYKTKGANSSYAPVFKMIINVKNKKDGSVTTYYVLNKYINGSWNMDIDTKRQKDF